MLDPVIHNKDLTSQLGTLVLWILRSMLDPVIHNKDLTSQLELLYCGY